MQSHSLIVAPLRLHRTPVHFVAMGIALLCMAWNLLAEQKGTPKRILGGDDSTRKLAIIGKDGAVEWEYAVGAIHDAHLLPNGNMLTQQGWQRFVS